MKDILRLNPEKAKKKLNGKTPVWFKDWYALEYVPLHIKVNILMYMAGAILIGVMISILTR